MDDRKMVTDSVPGFDVLSNQPEKRYPQKAQPLLIDVWLALRILILGSAFMEAKRKPLT